MNVEAPWAFFWLAALNNAGRIMELECKGAVMCQSSISKDWIEVLFSNAAGRAPSFWLWQVSSIVFRMNQFKYSMLDVQIPGTAQVGLQGSNVGIGST